MKNPWLGLQSYTEESLKEYQFNGRALASASVASLIRQNLFVTLYGRSGIGKTSLLQAGVFPILRREGFYPVTIRLNNLEDGKDAATTEDNAEKLGQGEAAKVIWDTVSEALKEHGFIYRSNPCEKEKNDKYKVDFCDTLVLRILFSAGRFLNDKGEEGIPVMVIDQFEEILYKAPDSATLLVSQLYALIDDNYNLSISHPSWHDDTNFRIVVSIREDDLYLFEDYIDTLNCIDFKSNRYRLLPLSESEAKDVVLKPIEGKQIFEDGKEEDIAKKIIELAKNNGQRVNTLLLSLLCYVLYNNIVRKGRSVMLSDLYNYNDIIETYYLEVIKDLPSRQRYYIEDNLVDEQGRRKTVYNEDIETFAPRALPLIKNFKVSKDQKISGGANDTIESKILFIESQGRVELIHDQLAASILKIKNSRKSRRTKQIGVMGIVVALLAFIFYLSLPKVSKYTLLLSEDDSINLTDYWKAKVSVLSGIDTIYSEEITKTNPMAIFDVRNDDAKKLEYKVDFLIGEFGIGVITDSLIDDVHEITIPISHTRNRTFIDGIVTTRVGSKAPIYNALVIIDDKIAKTNYKGEFSLYVDSDLKDSTIRIIKKGYYPLEERLGKRVYRLTLKENDNFRNMAAYMIDRMDSCVDARVMKGYYYGFENGKTVKGAAHMVVALFGDSILGYSYYDKIYNNVDNKVDSYFLITGKQNPMNKTFKLHFVDAVYNEMEYIGHITDESQWYGEIFDKDTKIGYFIMD